MVLRSAIMQPGVNGAWKNGLQTGHMLEMRVKVKLDGQIKKIK